MRAISRSATALAIMSMAAGLVTLSLTSPPVNASAARPAHAVAAAATNGPFVTLLFSRTSMTAADDCVVNNTGIARLDTTVAPYLTARGLTATGTLTTSQTKENVVTCVHYKSTMSASWSQARTLATNNGWTFVSHTATYPGNLSGLTPEQSEAETCGSAQAIDAHGLPGGHGLIAYPGAQTPPTDLQTNYSARCFAWGRQYGQQGITAQAAGTTSPYWQRTIAPNGGPCNMMGEPCYSVVATGSQRYTMPWKIISTVRDLEPGEWFTLQAYVLVTGKSPAYGTSPIEWDCTDPAAREHWSNDNERYCYRDWRKIIKAIQAVPGVTVTDPLTVGVAFGRPATYP